MTDYFATTLFPMILKLEGTQFTNDPSDAGGPTKFGITAAKLGEWRKLGRVCTAAEVQQLQQSEAMEIYRQDFFVGPGFSAVCDIDQNLGTELFEAGVNCGRSVPGVWMQRILNVLNNGGQLWADVKTDGQIGPATIAAYKSLIAQRGMTDASGCILEGCESFQFVRYVELAEGRPVNEKYEWGWLKQRVGWS